MNASERNFRCDMKVCWQTPASTFTFKEMKFAHTKATLVDDEVVEEVGRKKIVHTEETEIAV
jgi:hypothetical protein